MYLYLVGKKLLLFEHHVWIGHAKSQWKEKNTIWVSWVKKISTKGSTVASRVHCNFGLVLICVNAFWLNPVRNYGVQYRDVILIFSDL